MLATELRKNLFHVLEKAAKGDTVLIEYKGTSFRLEAVRSQSKLASAVRRRAIVGNPDPLIGSDIELLEGLDAKWANEDSEL